MNKNKIIIIILSALIILLLVFLGTYQLNKILKDKALENSNNQVAILKEIYSELISKSQTNVKLGDSAICNFVTGVKFTDEQVKKLKIYEQHNPNIEGESTLNIRYDKIANVLTISIIDDDNKSVIGKEIKLEIKINGLSYKKNDLVYEAGPGLQVPQ